MKIQIPGVVIWKVATGSDGGIRVTLDIPEESAIEATKIFASNRKIAALTLVTSDE